MAQMNEELLETKYEGNAFARLFAYVKPHIKTMLLALLLVLIVTGIDLVKPVLIGSAIDDYIEGYGKPYAVVTADRAQIELNEGLYLSAELPENEEAEIVRLIYFEEKYFLVWGLKQEDLEALSDWEKDGCPGFRLNPFSSADPQGWEFELNGQHMNASPMNSEQLSSLRAADRSGIGRIALLYTGLLIVGFVLQMM